MDDISRSPKAGNPQAWEMDGNAGKKWYSVRSKLKRKWTLIATAIFVLTLGIYCYTKDNIDKYRTLDYRDGETTAEQGTSSQTAPAE